MDCLQCWSLLINFKMSKCFVSTDSNENDLNGNSPFFCFCLQTIIVNKISNRKPILLFTLRRNLGHNWPNWEGKQRLNINTITLLQEKESHYQLADVFKTHKWMSCLWQQLKMDNYDETSRGEQSLEDMIFPEVIPLPPAGLQSPPRGTIHTVALTDWQIRLISTFHLS